MGGPKKVKKHDDVIFEWSQSYLQLLTYTCFCHIISAAFNLELRFTLWKTFDFASTQSSVAIDLEWLLWMRLQYNLTRF